jgi:hypothetical protein
MLVGGPIAQIPDIHRQVPRRDAFAQDALGQEAVQHARKQRQNIDGGRHGKRKIALAEAAGRFAKLE